MRKLTGQLSAALLPSGNDVVNEAANKRGKGFLMVSGR